MGLIVFLIVLIIVAILLNLLIDQFGPVNPKIKLIVGLLLLLFVILWLFGGGGYSHLSNWNFPR